MCHSRHSRHVRRRISNCVSPFRNRNGRRDGSNLLGTVLQVRFRCSCSGGARNSHQHCRTAFRNEKAIRTKSSRRHFLNEHEKMNNDLLFVCLGLGFHIKMSNRKEIPLSKKEMPAGNKLKLSGHILRIAIALFFCLGLIMLMEGPLKIMSHDFEVGEELFSFLVFLSFSFERVLRIITITTTFVMCLPSTLGLCLFGGSRCCCCWLEIATPCSKNGRKDSLGCQSCS